MDTKILRDDFEPDMLTKPLQPFLRFNMDDIVKRLQQAVDELQFEPFLRFYTVWSRGQDALKLGC